MNRGQAGAAGLGRSELQPVGTKYVRQTRVLELFPSIYCLLKAVLYQSSLIFLFFYNFVFYFHM